MLFGGGAWAVVVGVEGLGKGWKGMERGSLGGEKDGMCLERMKMKIITGL